MKFGRLRGVRRLSLTVSLSVVAFLIIGAAITVAATVHSKKPTGPASAAATHTRATTGPAKQHKTKKTKRGGKDAGSGNSDYEFSGTGNDTGSFELVSSASTSAVTDLVVEANITCTDAPTPQTPVDTQVISGTFPVNSEGAFSGGKIINGNGTIFSGTISSGKLTLTYRHVSTTPNDWDGSQTVCDTGNVALSGAPGSRQALPTGIWTGRVAGNPVTLRVVAGGRALEPSGNTQTPAGGLFGAAAFGAFTEGDGTAGATPTSNWNCAFNDPSAEFIAKNGTFGDAQWNDGDTYSSEGDGDDPYYTGTFTSPTSVSGSFWNGGEGCINDTWQASAPN